MADFRYVTYDQALALAQAAKEKYTNQDAIGIVTINGTSFTAAEAVDELKFVNGDNITMTINGDTVTIAATDTTYDPAVASVAGVGGTDGLLTAGDKEKLDGIEDGAEVNQNAFATVKYGATEIGATAKQDTFEVAAGTNVTITPDASNKKVTIAATDTTYSDVVADSTGAADSGLMTSDDKAKLDGIEDGAQANVLEGVKVNGTALTPTNKVVDVTVTTGSTGVGTFAVNGTDVAPHGLGTAAAADVSVAGVTSGDTGLVTGDQVNTAINARVASAYKVGGSLAPSGVVSSLLVAANEGKVYNVSADMTLDATSAALFIDGASGDVIEGGTNIVVVDTGSGTYKFDKLAGFVDLSPYAEKSDLGGLTEAELAAVIAAL